MCKFCTEHGEGKKWYLEMENYSKALLHEELTATQREYAEAGTRFEWLNDFIETFIMPATGISPKPPRNTQEQSPAPPVSQKSLSVDEILEQRQTVHYGQVLPIEDVDEVIRIADSITRMPCGCRYRNTGKLDQRYCFGLGIDTQGILGKYPDSASSLEVLEKEEALKLFHHYDQEGLIHSVWTGVTPYVIGLCNCDRDCSAYKYYIEKSGIQWFFRAEYICSVDWDLCTGCKECMSQCQFGAQFYSSALEKVYISPQKCFGCGVCRAACPNGAINLLPRHESQEAANLW